MCTTKTFFISFTVISLIYLRLVKNRFTHIQNQLLDIFARKKARYYLIEDHFQLSSLSRDLIKIFGFPILMLISLTFIKLILVVRHYQQILKDILEQKFSKINIMLVTVVLDTLIYITQLLVLIQSWNIVEIKVST